MKELLSVFGVTFIAFIIVGAIGAAGFLGYRAGVNETAFKQGEDYGIQSTVATINHLLEDSQTHLFIRYTPEDDTYHLVIKQHTFKREVTRREKHGS